MKIQLLLTILLLSTAGAIYAQPSSKDAHRHYPTSLRNQQLYQLPNCNFSSPILQQEQPNKAAKTTAGNASRCIAEVNYNTDSATSTFVVIDSIYFMYSDTRGNFKYDSAFSYANIAGTYSINSRFTQTFDANNNVTLARSQSWEAVTGSWLNISQSIYTFDANNNMLTEIDQNWDTLASAWVNNYQTIYTYDANNNRLSETDKNWNIGTSVWDNFIQIINTYDANNNRISDMGKNWNLGTSVWDNNYRDTFTYDGIHNMLYTINQYGTSGTSTWTNNYFVHYAYTTTNKVARWSYGYWDTTYNNWPSDTFLNIITYNTIDSPIELITLSWDSSATTWYNDTFKTVYTYDGSNDCILQTSGHYYSGTWHNETRDSFSNFAGSVAQIDVYQQFNGTRWVNQYETTNLQNSFSQIIYNNKVHWDTITATFKPNNIYGDIAYRYYYELYYTDVKSISNTLGIAYIYPIPAKNTLTLDINWDTPQAFAITLFDMQGRIMKQYDVAATTQYKDELPINDLPTGTYILNIEGTTGKIVKQIVIAR